MKIAKSKPYEGKPKIMMPGVYGITTGKECLYRIPVLGERPMNIEIIGSLEGLTYENNIISGVIKNDCSFEITVVAENNCGRDEKKVLITVAEDNALRTPLLGFTSWNAYIGRVSQNDIEHVADKMFELGLVDYGYSYVNLDSGWQKEYGGKYYAIMPNEKFPDMAAMCNKLHKKGLKCGMYSTPMSSSLGYPMKDIPGCTQGERDIRFCPRLEGVGKEHYEGNNVKQWDEWGFDYLKYDWSPTDTYNADLMKQELLKAKRDMPFCVTVKADPGYYMYWQKNCCSFRNNADSIADWENVKERLFTTDVWKDYIIPGHFYDLDMLEIGEISSELTVERLTPNEAIFSYTMRAFFLSPIQISCNLDNLTDVELDILSNDEVIMINQDSLCNYPEKIYENKEKGIIRYKRELENGDIAIAIFNYGEEEFEDSIEFENEAQIRDVWAKKDLGKTKEFKAEVEPHCARVFRIKK